MPILYFNIILLLFFCLFFLSFMLFICCRRRERDEETSRDHYLLYEIERAAREFIMKPARKAHVHYRERELMPALRERHLLCYAFYYACYELENETRPAHAECNRGLTCLSLLLFYMLTCAMMIIMPDILSRMSLPFASLYIIVLCPAPEFTVALEMTSLYFCGGAKERATRPFVVEMFLSMLYHAAFFLFTYFRHLKRCLSAVIFTKQSAIRAFSCPFVIIF